MGGNSIPSTTNTNVENIKTTTVGNEHTGDLIENFLKTKEDFIQKNWEYICEHSDVKGLLKIPELTNIVVDNIKGGIDDLSIHLATDFEGDIHQLISASGVFTKENKWRIGERESGVVRLYLHQITVIIRQTPLYGGGKTTKQWSEE